MIRDLAGGVGRMEKQVREAAINSLWGFSMSPEIMNGFCPTLLSSCPTGADLSFPWCL